MAQFREKLWLLMIVLIMTLPVTHTGLPTIRFRGEKEPLLEENNVTLECLTDEPGEDLSGFTFQKYSTWLRSWISLDKAKQLRCWFFDVAISRDDGHLLLNISNLQSWHNGLYRCVSSNATGNASASKELELNVEYLHGIFLTRVNTWCGTVGDSVTVLEGSTLELECSADASQPPFYQWKREGEDWIEASSTLILANMGREQMGTYTCQARHPIMPQLSQNKSINVFVEGRGERAYTFDSMASLTTPMLALAVALPAVLLLLVVLVVAFLIPRHRAAGKKKAALEDSSQRTPIYKGSLESVPSVVADTHPLVI